MIQIAGPPSWMPDEQAMGGRENFDPGHIARYDGKMDAAAQAEVALLQSLGLTPRSTIVEYGPGTGQFTIAAAPCCARIAAVDVSQPMLDRLASNLARQGIVNVDCIRAGFLTYRHEGELADFVYSRFALHHLPDFWKSMALGRIRALMRPGAIFRLWDVVYDFPLAEAADRLEAWCSTGGEEFEGEWSRAEIEEHVRDEHSTFSWLLEAMFAPAKFDLVHADHATGGFEAKYVLRAA